MRPFDDLRDALAGAEDVVIGGEVRSDPRRSQRTGTPEIIYAARKSVAQVLSGVAGLIEVNGRVVISHLSAEFEPALRASLPPGLELTMAPGSRSGVVAAADSAPPDTGGRVGVITAGTSDVAAASEAALIAREMGCEIRTSWDVGVAGIHRLVQPLEAMTEWDADVIIVAAGMDGILPTVVSGLVAQPIIGLPVSSGYGFGGEGIGALTTMLQTCSPGLAVVKDRKSVV